MRILFVAFLIVSGAVSARAQNHQPPATRVEVEGGAGYSVGGGLEGPAPSVASWSAGVSVWLTQHWGLSMSRIAGIGDEVLPRQSAGAGGDREAVLTTGLRVYRIGGRYRRALGRTRLVAGLGVVQGSHIDRSRLLSDGRIVEASHRWGGLLAELHGERDLSQRLALRVGISFNGSSDPFVIQPQGTLVLRF